MREKERNYYAQVMWYMTLPRHDLADPKTIFHGRRRSRACCLLGAAPAADCILSVVSNQQIQNNNDNNSLQQPFYISVELE